MRLKKILTIIIISLIIIIFSGTKSEASLYLKNLDFTAQLNEDGSMDVVETWDISVSETNTLYKTFKKDKTKYSGITNISVEEITKGKEHKFIKTDVWAYHLGKNTYFGGINNENDYEIAWGVSIDNTSRRQYLIRYTVKDAVKKYADCAELYWQFVGPNFEVSADSITGIVKLPAKVENKEALKVWGHTEYLNGEIYIKELDEVEFKLENYKAGKFVEVRIAMPTNLMNKVEETSKIKKLNSIIEEETKWANEANEKRAVRDKNMKIVITTVTVSCIAIGLFFITRISKNKQVLKENPKIKPEKELEYYRQLPDETATPLEAVFMLKKGYNQMYLSDVFSATILNLILKGYVKAEQEEKEIKMQILEKPVDELKEDEQKVYNLLNSASTDKLLTMKDLEKYIKKHPSKLTNIESNFENVSKKQAEKKGKFNKATQNKAGIYMAKAVGYIFLSLATFMAVLIGVGTTAEYVGNKVDYALIAGLFAIIVLIINLVLTFKIVGRFDGFTRKRHNRKGRMDSFQKIYGRFFILE